MQRHSTSALAATLISLASALSPAAHALQAVEPPVVHTQHDFSFTPPYRSIELGRLTDTEDMDALVLAEEHLFVVSSLGRFGAAQMIVPNAEAAAILSTESLGNPGLPDLIVASTGSAFARIVYHPGAQHSEFLYYPPLPFVAGLHDASLMATADLDGQGLPDLLTVSASDPRRVYGWTFDAFGNVAFHFTFATEADVTDLCAVRWRATDAADSVVVLTAGSLTVHDQLGGERYELVETLQSAGEVAVLPGASSAGADVLAYMRRRASVEWELTLLDDGGPLIFGGGDIGTVILPVANQAFRPVQVVGLQAADQDGDGDLDLLISAADYHGAFLYLNEPDSNGPTFDVNNGADGHYLFQEPFDQTVPVNPTGAAFEDLDGDGAADVIAMHHESGGMIRFWSDQVSPSGTGGTGAPLASTAPQIFGTLVREEIDADFDSGLFIDPLRLYFEIPASIDIDAFSHIQVQVWDRPAGGTLVPTALSNALYPIGDPCRESYSRRNFGIELDLGSGSTFTWDAGRLAFVTYRLVQASVSNGVPSIQSGGRWFNAGVVFSSTFQPDGTFDDELENDPEARAKR
ncbi:MAG: hypothetical protein AAFZ65_10980, partial [Planctomycetota bacterium]